ncbi:hypothetical protein VNO77_04488 [Canavalia gladiata]|uniref:Uncharacterized protein n=1 Tax=Canavalia gladiata TaxID=3824 RepID=A0AAN9N1R2_CANGL
MGDLDFWKILRGGNSLFSLSDSSANVFDQASLEGISGKFLSSANDHSHRLHALRWQHLDNLVPIQIWTHSYLLRNDAAGLVCTRESGILHGYSSPSVRVGSDTLGPRRIYTRQSLAGPDLCRLLRIGLAGN